MMPTNPKIAFITNFCSHYRVKTFELLAKNYENLEYYFFSAGDEWYWQKEHGVNTGDFPYRKLPGIKLFNTRIVPSLLVELLKGNHDIYIKCINGRFSLPLTFIISKLRKKPFILWTGIWTRLQTPFHKLFFPIIRYIYQHANAIVTYGEHVEHYLVTEGVNKEKIFNTKHAVDNSTYNISVNRQVIDQLREKLNISSNKKVILFLGRLEENKGLKYLISAIARLKELPIVLVVAGKGSEEDYLRHLVQQLNLEDIVRFTGYVPIANTVEYYAMAYILVLPSISVPQGKETWGLVINEAFNQGVPVIVTDAVGAAIGGLVEDTINGFIVSEKNMEELADSIFEMVNDPILRKKMSDNARIKIANWDNEQMILGFNRAIQYVSNNKNS